MSPYYYTMQGTTLKVTPSYTGNLEILYYKRFPAVTADNIDGPMIQEHGMLYFNAVMYEAQSFVQDIELASGWLARFRAVAAGINKSAHDVRAGGARVRSIARAIG